jgi:hypothetical protein
MLRRCSATYHLHSQLLVQSAGEIHHFVRVVFSVEECADEILFHKPAGGFMIFIEVSGAQIITFDLRKNR